MKNFKLVLMMFFVLLTLTVTLPFTVSAQTQYYVPPVELYRFRVPGNNLGYKLTPYYSQGINSGFIYEGVVGFIYVPNLGGIPVLPGTTNPGLKAIYEWRVVQNGRLYFYYTNTYTSHGSDYTYQGIVGYMYDPLPNTATVTFLGSTQTFPLYKITRCYSQSYGYWYGYRQPINANPEPAAYYVEPAPNSSFNCGPEHGIVGGGIFTTRGTRPGAITPVPEYAISMQDGTDDQASVLFEDPSYPPPPPPCGLMNSNSDDDLENNSMNSIPPPGDC